MCLKPAATGQLPVPLALLASGIKLAVIHRPTSIPTVQLRRRYPPWPGAPGCRVLRRTNSTGSIHLSPPPVHAGTGTSSPEIRLRGEGLLRLPYGDMSSASSRGLASTWTFARQAAEADAWDRPSPGHGAKRADLSSTAVYERALTSAARATSNRPSPG